MQGKAREVSLSQAAAPGKSWRGSSFGTPLKSWANMSWLIGEGGKCNRKAFKC